MRRALVWSLPFLISLCASASALAAFPGRNGELVLAAACATPAPGCHGLEVVRPDGSGLRLLCPNVPQCAHASAPAWSPDGRRVAFLPAPFVATGVQGGPDVVYGDGSCFSCLWSGRASGDAGTLRRPAWTSDGHRLADETGLYAGTNGSFYPDGAALDGDDGLAGPPLLPGRGWAPDAAVSVGGELAFARRTGGMQRNLFLIRLGGRRARRLTRRGGEQPAFSPDGRRLAFVRRGDLYLIGVDGAGLRLLARDATDPGFSPDGKLVAFVRRQGAAPGEVMIVGARGGRPRAIPSVTADEIDWQPLVGEAPPRCRFDHGARIIARGRGVVVATRSSSVNGGDGEGQLWLACLTAQGKPRVVWATATGELIPPSDELGQFRVAGRWLAFVATVFEGHYPDEVLGSVEVLDMGRGTLRPSPETVLVYHGGFVALAPDSAGDVTWIVMTLDEVMNANVAQVGVQDATGTRVLDQAKPGELTGLRISAGTVSWRSAGQPRFARITPR